jgi:hypothetical protein
MTTRIYYHCSVPYVAKGRPAPESFKDPCSCGSCGRTWDDGKVTGMIPAPAGRCPFEYMRGHSAAVIQPTRRQGR